MVKLSPVVKRPSLTEPEPENLQERVNELEAKIAELEAKLNEGSETK